MLQEGNKYRFYYDPDIADEKQEERDLCMANNGHIVEIISLECSICHIDLYHVRSDTGFELFVFEHELCELEE